MRIKSKSKFNFVSILIFILIVNPLPAQNIKNYNSLFHKMMLFSEKFINFKNSFDVNRNNLLARKNYSQHAITAREKLDTVKLIAQSYSSDSELKAILLNEDVYHFLDDTIDGRASGITYYFNSVSKGYFSVYYSPNIVILDSSTIPPPFTGGTVTLPEFFVDSDIISDSAEANGGTEFRNEEGTFTIVFYDLRNFSFNDFIVPDTINPYWRVVYAKSDTFRFKEFLIYYLSPVNGSIITKFKISFETFTIKEKFSLVDSLAKSYDINSKLMYAMGIEDSLFDGKILIANYGYLGENNKKFSVNLFFGNPVIDDTSGWIIDDIGLSRSINLNDYLDSDTLMMVSEINGGYAFRDSFHVLTGGFIYSQSPFDTTKIYFHSIYNAIDSSTGYYKNLFNLIDPVTGEFVNSIILKTENDLPPIPNNLILFQNYPNPFNSSTKVRYILPVSSRVSLKVYDLVGREVKDIFVGYQNAGEYELVLDFKNLTSGVYFYVLKTDYQSIARKLILLK